MTLLKEEFRPRLITSLSGVEPLGLPSPHQKLYVCIYAASEDAIDYAATSNYMEIPLNVSQDLGSWD